MIRSLIYLFGMVAILGCSSNYEDTYEASLDTVFVENQIAEIDLDTAEVKSPTAADSTAYYRICNEEYDCGYRNFYGDTIIPLGKYVTTYTDTFQNFAIVLTQDLTCIGIDKDEKKMYDIFWFEQGPDYVQEGLFRIVKHNKIGYANAEGDIIIDPIYTCAWPFKNGLAKVSLNCTKVPTDPEHWTWESDEWFYIDKSGKVSE